ncbi:Kinesin light chain [Seminavis robusta]|uniref:Kinesin light chain n=1 Tax=Seminavis robusta TaxID=568900 RepID=A0A9N8E9N1_9STRA|nr:Kinesin light chain [Seminavis robusta]|eukprot:Sro828_g207980.1 Kinesin light chain (1110) ;mRNA; f:25807-29683
MPFRRSKQSRKEGLNESNHRSSRLYDGQEPVPWPLVVHHQSHVVPFTVPATPQKKDPNDTSGLTEFDTSFDETGFVVLQTDCTGRPNINVANGGGPNPQRRELVDLMKRTGGTAFIAPPKRDNDVVLLTPPKQKRNDRGASKKQLKKINSLEDLADQEESPATKTRRHQLALNISWSPSTKHPNKNPKGRLSISNKRGDLAVRRVKVNRKPVDGAKTTSPIKKATVIDNNTWKNTAGTDACEWIKFGDDEVIPSAFVSFSSMLSRPLTSSAVTLSMLSSKTTEGQEDCPVWNDPPDGMVRDSIYRHIQICMDLRADKKGTTNATAAKEAAKKTASPASIPVDVDDVCFVETADPETVDAVAIQNIMEGKPHGALDFLSVLLQDQRKERLATDSEVMLEGRIATTKSHCALVSLLAMSPKEAWQYSMSALQTHKKAGRPVQTAFATIELGLVFMGKDKLKEALRTWREALQLTCMTLGYDHGQVALLLSNMGCLHCCMGNNLASLRALEESLGLQRQLLRSIMPEDSVDMPLFNIATTLGNLAILKAKFQNYDAAVGLLEEALAIQESILVTSEKVKGTTKKYLTWFEKLRDEADDVNERNDASFGCFPGPQPDLCNTGDRELALSIFGDSDGIPRRHEGTKHHQTTSQSNAGEDDNNFDCVELGSLVKRSAARQRVSDTVHRSLERSSDKMGEQSSLLSCISTSRKKQSILVDIDADSVIDAEFHLEEIHLQALDHLSRKEYKDAFDLFQMSLRSHKDKYGDVHHLVGTALHNCGIVNLMAGQYALAKPFFQEAVSVRTASLGETHPDVAASKYKLGLIQFAGGDPEGALASFADVMLHLGANPCTYGFLSEAKMLNNIGVVQFEIGQTLDSFQSFFRAYEVQKGLLKEGSHCAPVERGLASTLCNLGYVYAEQKQYSDALDAYQQALTMLKWHYPMKNAAIMTIQENIAHVKAYGAVSESDVLPKCTPLKAGVEDAPKFVFPSCTPVRDRSATAQSKVFGSCIPHGRDKLKRDGGNGKPPFPPRDTDKQQSQETRTMAHGDKEAQETIVQSKMPEKGVSLRIENDDEEEASFIQSAFGGCIPDVAELECNGENGQEAKSKLSSCFHME